MLPNNKTLFLITIFWICCNHTNAQTITDTCQQSDLPSVLFKNRTKETNSNDRFAMLLLPIIGSTPATGFFGGVGLQIVMRGSYVTDRYSSISGSMQFTAKRQKLLLAKNTVYLLHNKLFLMGDLRLLLFSQSTYGLGTNAPGKLQKALADLNGYSTNDDSLAQPMSYDYIKIHQTASWLIYPDLYVGGGFHIDKYQDINDIKLDTSSLSPRLTSHYLYNKIEGFNVNKYNLNGVSINAVFDSRDNLVNAYKGHFANINLRFNSTGLGSDKNSMQAYLEYRYFKSVSKVNPRNVLAFWTYLDWLVSGSLPYMTLPALGYDQRSRAGRGYSQGRFRGEKLFYAETEFRFNISPCTKVLGGVVFVNVITTSSELADVKLFEYVKPAVGAGLRLMVDKKGRTNLFMDYAFGKQSNGFYFGATETF